MRKKTENMDIIVDKKTVRVTTAVFASYKYSMRVMKKKEF